MKHFISHTFKQVYEQKYLFILLCVFVIVAFLLVAHMAITLQPNELRVVTQYTAYGVTHFYRSEWTAFIGYILFVIMTVVLYAVLSVKMLLQERKSLAIALLWIGLFMVLFAWLTFVRLTEFS